MEESELCFPHLNSSCGRQKRTPTRALIYTALSSVAFLTTFLNLLLIVSISHFRQLHTSTNLLLLSLAVSDFFVGLLMSFLIILTDGCWYLGDYMCALYAGIDSIIITTPVGTMVLISVDRYVAICDPLHYPNRFTTRRVSVFICLCWFCSVLYVSVILKDFFRHPGRYNSCYGECVVVMSYTVGIVDFVLMCFGPVTIIIVLYLRVFAVAVSQARAVRVHVAAVTLKRTGVVHTNRSEIKAARTLGVVVVAFLICYCPYYCSSFAEQSFQFGSTSVPVETWVLYFNSGLNPLIYAFCYPWFWRSVKLIVTLKVVQPGSSGANILT